MIEENIIDQNKKTKAWVVAVDMGYGHQRTAYPLRDLAPDKKVINANNYEGILQKDKNLWKVTRSFYEFISRFKRVPLVGEIIFSVALDKFQRISEFYPKRDLSKPGINTKNVFSFIKRGWIRDLIEKFKKRSLPLVSTFFTTAFAAEENNYLNDIYCVVCDADANRSWAPFYPKISKIKYFAPCTWVRDRLKLYGVAQENIFLTGFPLPKENLGSENLEILKEDLRNRILNLDPLGNYRKMYGPLIKGYLGDLPKESNHPLTVLFSVGGAGAQKEIALYAINSLKAKIKQKKLRFIISVGIRKELKDYYAKGVKDLELDGWVHILYGKDIQDYFEKFNQALRQTDVLWTKPSELSFYAALGLPIIIAPCIGSQEEFNKRWLLHIGSGVLQENPKYADQWFFDLLNGGDFAEVAMQGFVEIEKLGTYNIEKIISNK